MNEIGEKTLRALPAEPDLPIAVMNIAYLDELVSPGGKVNNPLLVNVRRGVVNSVKNILAFKPVAAVVLPALFDINHYLIRKLRPQRVLGHRLVPFPYNWLFINSL